tara:strand:- start:5793 stop:6842 length:1050 start_codon:yes stop_codon:yes gene_type:complete
MENKLRISTLLCVLLLFGSILFYSNILNYPIVCKSDDFILEIEPDSSASHVAIELEDNLCINSNIFKLAIYTTFNQQNIKPGLYSLKGIRSLHDLIKLITSISKDRTTVTIFEGWNIKDIANRLSSDTNLNIDKNKFISLCYNNAYIKSLGIDYNIMSLEGFLYPDTYILLNTYNERDIIKILTKRFMDIYNHHIYPLSSNNKLNLIEIIALASIIQGEAQLVSEMPIISSVYHNRMNRKMRLEADPTILYYMDNDDLKKFKKYSGKMEATKIFKKYKKTKNPYNTYLNYGLPVGPINNPGLKALEAALNPSLSNEDLLYFVADGTGGHIFSKTLKEHKRAIRKIRNGY